MIRHAVLLAALLTGAAPAAAETIAIVHAHLAIGDGSAPIADGAVVMRDGRILAAGAGVAPPPGARVIDAEGKWVSAGIVAGFSVLGIVEIDGVATTNDAAAGRARFSAALDVSTAVNAAASPIAINRAAGVTRAIVAPAAEGAIFGGQGAVIDLGADPDAVTRARAFQYVELGEQGARAAGGSRPAAHVALRAALVEARDYAHSPQGYGGHDETLRRADAAALVPVIEGRQKLLIHVERASDILGVIALHREFPTLDIVIAGASEGWRVAPQLAAARIPVIASASIDLPASFETLAATQSNIGRLRAAGVHVAIGLVSEGDPRQARSERQFAGNLVGLIRIPGAAGLAWGAAFAAISSVPADVMGLGTEIGSLRPGRRADVVIWDGDPLEPASAALAVYIDGVAQPLSNHQTELRDRYLTPTEGALPKAYEH